MDLGSVTISSPYEGRPNKAEAGDSGTKGTGPQTVPSLHYTPSEPPGEGTDSSPLLSGAGAQEWCAQQSVSD